MNYDFDNNIIHDDKAMWFLALTFKTEYNFIREQVISAKTKGSILYDGHVIMKWDENYQKILSKYKTQLEFLNEVLEFELKQKNSMLKKYIRAN